MSTTLVKLAGLDVTVLNGVGPAKAKGLAEMGVDSVLDLVLHYPRRYVDRTREARIADLEPGDEALVVATVQRISSRTIRNRRVMVNAELAEGEGSASGGGRLRVTFFNQRWREKQLPAGTQVAVFGKVELFNGQRQMTNPVVDLLGDRTGRIVPLYPQSERSGLATWELASLIAESLRRAREIHDPVPDAVLARWGLLPRTQALHTIHQPDAMADVDEARRRLVFDELLRVQLVLVQRKRLLEQTAVGIAHEVGGSLVDRFVDRLPFELTQGQREAIDEIQGDLAAELPMHRLLQGDVGAGKTVVAVAALLTAVQGGHQGALMAPTEVLAEQHALSVRSLLEGFTVVGDGEGTLFAGGAVERPLAVELLTNRTRAADRRRILAGLGSGDVDLVIGTHALIQDAVAFRSLGVVVIDEQHRFGVEQRAALRAKSAGEAVPDVLVMTATPIPRTAAMTVYGDLDVSLLRQKPGGREPIVTSWARDEADQAEVWQAVREEVGAGRQAYVVCPLIEESDKLQVASAEETYEALVGGELHGLAVGLLHGRVAAAARDETMQRFRDGSLDVLVATTVIEVGVDVPNATVMVIIDADRFGIAQLHQLRGRVGRGTERSRCFLLAEGKAAGAEARMEALVGSEDGFELAEIDLDLRGEGTIMGARQKGQNDLRLASLRRDRAWVERARAVAFELVGDDPSLRAHPDLAAELEVLLPDEDVDYLLKG